MEDMIVGRLGGEDGYIVQCAIDGDKIAGRAGGKLYGQPIHLEITERGVQGTVGTDSVQIGLEGGELRGQVGDQKVVLRGVDRVTGSLGDPTLGWKIAAQQQGTTVKGQLGSIILGHSFELSLGSAPGWVGVLVAVIAFYALEPRARAV